MKYKKCKRLNYINHAHELTFSCYKKQNFLKHYWICKILFESLDKSRKKHGFKLIAFVFMPDHVHLLIHPKHKNYSISKILYSIKFPVAQKVISHIKLKYPEELFKFETGTRYKPYRFWQSGGGYDRNIVSEKAIISSIEYIHNNPVKSNLIDVAENWLWSSANPKFAEEVDNFEVYTPK